jgi:hypothetical protein
MIDDVIKTDYSPLLNLLNYMLALMLNNLYVVFICMYQCSFIAYSNKAFNCICDVQSTNCNLFNMTNVMRKQAVLISNETYGFEL